MRDPSHDDPRGVVVLCMSLTAGIALAIESVWAWIAWLAVGVGAAAGAYLTLAAARERARAEKRRDGHAAAD